MRWRISCRLTVKLRGRAQAPDRSRERMLSSSAHGDATALHGPLQRLLGAVVLTYVLRHSFIQLLKVLDELVAVSLRSPTKHLHI
jgi:hypothetical protein